MTWFLKLIPGAIELGKKLLGNQRREDKLDNELASQKVAAREKRRRALIKASPWPLRLVAMVAWFGPFIAPAWPGVTVADVTSYVDAIINGMPDWYINIGLMMYGFLWGGSEWKSLVADRDQQRITEKEIERDAEKARTERPGPPNGGGR
jgi:hypothetical protein